MGTLEYQKGRSQVNKHMIFISRYKNFRLGIRPTMKQLVNNNTGSEEVIVHKGVTVEFENAFFDTKNWAKYSRPDSPTKVDVVKSEDDLIRLMKASPYFGTDFFERKIETKAEQRAKLKVQLAQLEAEENADNPENAPSIDYKEPIESKPKAKGKGKSASKVLL